MRVWILIKLSLPFRINRFIVNLSERLQHVGNLRKIPVILIDSRGRNLEEQVDPSRHPENTVGEEKGQKSNLHG